MSKQIGITSRMETGGRPPGMSLFVRNGRIALSSLDHLVSQTHLGDGAYVWKGRGKATDRMVATAKRDGVTLRFNAAYRNYAGQVSVGRYWAARGLPGNAAVPGTSSHGFAFAFDLDTGYVGSRVWMSKNGMRFGWDQPLWADDGKGTEEDWHYQGIRDWKDAHRDIAVYVGGKLEVGIEAFIGDGGRSWVEVRETVEKFGGVIDGFPPDGVQVRIGSFEAVMSFVNEYGVGFTQTVEFRKFGLRVEFIEGAIHIG